MRHYLWLLAALLWLASAVGPAWAEWGTDGNPVCTAVGNQVLPMCTSDEAQGAYVVWTDRRGKEYDIYAQRMTGGGAPLWVSSGVPICTATGVQEEVEFVYDGTGAVIITWHDTRGADTDIYAQKVDALGNVAWPSDGVPVCTAPGNQQYPKIISDGAGGAIITWQDFRSSASGIYAQRIDTLGKIVWTDNGVRACNALAYRPSIVSDGAGGAIVAWWDARDGNKDVFAQRILANGTVHWTGNGIEVCTTGGDQQVDNEFYWSVSDGSGGAIVTWTDQRSGGKDVYAQRIDGQGQVVWTRDGVPVSTVPGDQYGAEIASDGAGGAIVSWNDKRAGSIDIYGQRIDSLGSPRWTIHGVSICSAVNDQFYPKIIADGLGGAFIIWNDSRVDPSTRDIYAQRVDATGDVQWQTDGFPACGAASTQALGFLTTDGDDGAIVVWYDYRNSNYDIYANKVNPGQAPAYAPLIVSVRDVPRDEGGKIGLQWLRSDLDVYPSTDVTYYTVWRRLPSNAPEAMSAPFDSVGGSGDFDADGLPKTSRGGQVFRSGYAWEWLASVPARYFDVYAFTVQSLYDSTGSDTGWQYLMVSAQTWDPSVFFDSPIDSGYSVDNIPPSPPQSFAGEYKAMKGIELSWSPNGEVDFDCYSVYRGSSEDFPTDPEHLVVETTETAFTDVGESLSSRFYKLVAVDLHGNTSSCALLRPEEIIGADTGSKASVFALGQNHPNPFNPSTRIDFSTDERTHVTLEVYDVSGRLIRTLVSREMEAGVHWAEWDGQDEQGGEVASGTYLIRLRAGEKTQGRKAVLLK